MKLHEAVRAGDAKAVKRLLATSNVNAADGEWRTPLHYAYRGEIVRILIEHGANPRVMDRYGIPAWAYILARGDAEAVWLISAFVNPEYRDYAGRSFMHYAAMNIYAPALEIIREVWPNRYDVNDRDYYGKTPIYYAASPVVFRMLLKDGADVAVKAAEVQYVKGEFVLVEDISPWHVAARYGAPHIEALLQFDAYKDHKDSLGRTPREYARDPETLRLIDALRKSARISL